MFITTFTYTKADGTESERVLVPFSSPSKFYAGVDISELDAEGRALYLTDLSEVRAEYEAKLKDLETKHDLRYRYRKFDEAKITNLKHETI